MSTTVHHARVGKWESEEQSEVNECMSTMVHRTRVERRGLEGNWR
jgi:hypothetical protein